MDVWLAEWDYSYDMERSVTVFLTEKDALADVMSDIEDYISNNWDMDNSDQSQYADEISILHQQGKLREAMDKWNEYQSNCEDDHAQYYSVTLKPVKGVNADSVIPFGTSSTYQATTSGATCRGPCGQYNEYANADRADGTHVCRQCSTFQHIFGTKS